MADDNTYNLRKDRKPSLKVREMQTVELESDMSHDTTNTTIPETLQTEIDSQFSERLDISDNEGDTTVSHIDNNTQNTIQESRDQNTPPWLSQLFEQINQQHQNLKTEINQQNQNLKAEINQQNQNLKQQISNLQTEVLKQTHHLKSELGELSKTLQLNTKKIENLDTKIDNVEHRLTQKMEVQENKFDTRLQEHIKMNNEQVNLIQGQIDNKIK